MSAKRMASNKWLKTFRILVLVVILLLVVIRFFRLDIDPPYFFTGFSQAYLTDPYHLTFHARNAVLFDEGNPFDYHRWDIFKNSLISGVAYLLFSFFGVSRITANLAAVLLSLGGLALFLFGMIGYRRSWEIIITAFLLMISSLLMFYGRVPFLENGLIFLVGLSCFVFFKYHQSRWGQFLTGFLIALTALTGKLFGFIMLAPVVISLFYLHRYEFIRPVVTMVVGAMAGVLVYAFVFYGGNFSIMLNYFSEQTIGMYGFPEGFRSPVGFFRQFLSYGIEYGFTYLSLMYVMITGLALIVIFLSVGLFGQFEREKLPLIFNISWVVFGVLMLMPFNYRPMRYEVFLLLPAAAIIAFVINGILENKTMKLSLNKRLLTIPLVFLILWYLISQVYLLLNPLEEAFLLTGLAALVVTIPIYLLLRRGRRFNFRYLMLALFLPLLGVLVVRQGLNVYKGLVQPDDYLEEFNHEIAQMIDSEAVVTGPFAPACTIDNNLKGIIYVFGLTRVEKDLFERFPITHILTDLNNWGYAVKEYPFLRESYTIQRLRFRDGTIELLRLPNARIPMTDYEKASMAFIAKNYDSALVYSERFNKKYPDNLSGRFGLMIARYAAGQRAEFLEEIKSLAADYAKNFRAHLFCRYCYRVLYQDTGNEKYNRLARYHFDIAKNINPTIKP